MRIIACGDLLFSSRNLAKRLDSSIVELLQSADAVFANAEFSCPQPNLPPAAGRGYITAVKPVTLDEFVDLNIRLVSFANNHTGDFGWEGVIDTMEAAEARNLIPCGLGRNLDDARLPRFLDTAKGRVGVVALGSTRSEVFLAANGGAGTLPRPGLNPLRWGRAYVLPDDQFEQLKAITRSLGIDESVREGMRVEVMPPKDENEFIFGSLFESALQIERGEKAHVRTWFNEQDCVANERSIRDAANRSDFTLVSLHTHEGDKDSWYSPEAPEFIERFARRAVDAGADTVVCHGAHFMRGVEIYNGKPIFYNLGSLLMEFEAGESIIGPEMYQAYGHAVDARPSELHRARAKNSAGEFTGFNAEARFSQNALAIFDVTPDGLACQLLPLDLGMNRERVLSRGLPETVTHQQGAEIASLLTRLSQRYGTRFTYDQESGLIKFS
ncbi:CapA family protein [Klebsiella indica]|uniref:CapA family protein n=1 Tax=Klebsiella indica TaxID=2582917 RepID=A0A5R9LM38_9ENTR|nr:CapA family protein [Klebsiella indica]TLV21980.1 CapA family protein [Klebsiella indica]